jgi:hypothetical protein
VIVRLVRDIAFSLVVLSGLLPAQVLPPDRLGDWEHVGVFDGSSQGIPPRAVVFCDVRTKIPDSTLVAWGDGIRDDTEALQEALRNCPPGQVVYLPRGTYRISRPLIVDKGLVVRGAGPAATKIVQTSPLPVFRFQGGSTSFYYAAVGGHAELGIVQPLRSGFTRGSDSVVVEDTTEFLPGDVVLIDQLNDTALVRSAGTGGTCTWCGLGSGSDRTADGSRAMGETLIVTKREGKTVTFHRPLRYPYEAELQPRLIILSHRPVRNAGIEDLGLSSAQGNEEGSGITMAFCVNCWVRNVESVNIPQKHVDIDWGSCGNEIRDSFFHGTPRFDADHGYGINIHNYATDNLIENNVFYGLHNGVVIGSAGGSGNVVAYNVIDHTRHWQPHWFLFQIGTHGAHTFMNLFEGNVCGKVGLDSYWGSGSHNVFFRNRITRENSGQPVTSDITAVNIEAFNYYASVVGNILGQPGCRGPVEQIPFRDSRENPVLWKVGFEGAKTGRPTDPKVASTLIKTGNWECATGEVQWSSEERRIPDSLYLSAKPSWFGGLAWPPFTPERPGFDARSVPPIPAQIRLAEWLKGSDPDGPSSNGARR